MIEALFSASSTDRVNATVIGEAIFSEAKRLDTIKNDQYEINLEFNQHLANALKTDYPGASEEKITLVSSGVYACYLTAESLLPLKFIDQVHQLKLSAKLLCATLPTS